MATVITAPAPLPDSGDAVFLGGAIDMGKAVNWQQQVIDGLAQYDVYLLNPRRSDWNATWKQSKDDPNFRQQVEWELDAQMFATDHVYVFPKDSQAPITFLELGRFSRRSNVIVCCEEGFFRQGNIEIFCEREDIPLVPTINDLIAELQDAFVNFK